MGKNLPMFSSAKEIKEADVNKNRVPGCKMDLHCWEI